MYSDALIHCSKKLVSACQECQWQTAFWVFSSWSTVPGYHSATKTIRQCLHLETLILSSNSRWHTHHFLADWIQMFLFPTKKSLDGVENLAPIFIPATCYCKCLTKEHDAKLVYFILVQWPFIKEIEYPMLVAHFSARMNRSSVVQPPIVSIYLLCFIYEIV